MTQIGEGIAITTIAQEDDDETHHAGVMLCYPNGKPYTKRAPLLFSADGSDGIGLFNFEGQWVNFMLAPGAEVTYEIGEDVTDEMAATRADIKAVLDNIITAERAEKELQDALLAEEAWATQGLILTGAFLTGIGEGAVGLFEFSGDALELGGKAMWMKIQSDINMIEAGWEKYIEGDEAGFFDSLNEKNTEDFAAIFGVTPKELAQKMMEAYRIMTFIMDDAETAKLLLQFAEDYAKAQSHVEIAKVVGSAAFDIILGAILALTTGGAGNVAQVAAKMRHATLFNKLAKHLKKFTRLGEQKMLRKSVTGKLDEIVQHKVEFPKKQTLEKNPPKDESFKKQQNKEESNTQNDDTQSDTPNQDGTKGDSQTSEPGKNKNGDTCSPDNKTCQGGEPISLVTGEEILPLTDFHLEGPLPLVWERKYKSSNPDNTGLGHGWLHPFAQKLIVQNNTVELHNEEARIIPFNLPSIGSRCINAVEKLQIMRLSTCAFILTSTTGSAPIQYHFHAQHSNTSLSLTQIQDTHGNRYQLHYRHHQLHRIDADHGDQWQLDYNAHNNIEAIHWLRANGHQKTLVQYTYNDEDDLIRATDAAGEREHYAYNHHLLKKRTLKSGYSFHFKWSNNTPAARCIRNWGDAINGQATYDYTFEWDVANKRVAITDTRGGTETYQFNTLGLPLYHRDAQGGENRYRYDGQGNVVEQTTPLNHHEHFSYDHNSALVSHTNALGHKHRLIRDPNGNVQQSVDALGQHWRTGHNTKGQVTRQSNPLGESFDYEYNKLGLVSKVTNPLKQSWHYIWNHQGQLTAVRDNDGKHTRYSYNNDNQLTRIYWPDGQSTQYKFDANGNCTAIKTPEGQVQRYEYNALGLLTQHTDNSARVTTYEYNGLSQVVRRTDPAGQTLQYHYDGERNLIGLTNEKGEHYRLSYDLNERLIQEVGFDGRVQRYQYNAAGHLIASEDYTSDGKQCLNQITYQRDALGRLLQQTDGQKQQALNTFNYDVLGRLTQAKNQHRQLAWHYDAVGRVIEDHQDQHILKHQYNAAGTRTASLLPNGEPLSYDYDNSGAFAGLNYAGQQVANITRDAMGRELQRDLSNQLSTQQNYDPQGRLQQQRTFKSTGSNAQAPSISQRSYQYNALGQLAQIDDQRRGSTQYHYDRLDRLTKVEGPNPESFVHDPAGNILSTNSSAPAQQGQTQGNRLAFQGDTHYLYDSKGNRIAQARGKDQKIRTDYRYNALNQLTDVKNNDKQTTYAYDPLGRRITKANKNNRTDFLWFEDVLLSESSYATTPEAGHGNQNKEEKLYLFEPGTFKPLAFVQDEQVYHYHLDHLGTPQEISNAQGDIVWAVSYKAYGNLAVAFEQSIENNIRFQGQYYDGESGLHYNRFRYYDPGCGRFINQDPIGLAGGNNNYQYVPNPVEWIDPFGLTAKDCKKADKITKNAQEGKVRRGNDYHGRLGEQREQEILSNPSGVYKAKNENLIFHKDGDIVVTHGKGGAQGNVITSYGESGPRGDSGAAIYGGAPSDPGMPITSDMITNGRIPRPSGGTLPPATQIK